MPVSVPGPGFRTLFLLLLVFTLNGCVVIPEHLQLVAMDMDHGLKQVKAACYRENEAAPVKVGTRTEDVLDADKISLLNWNIYKGQRENWGEDFARLIQGQDIVVLQEAVLMEKMYQPLNIHHPFWSLNTAFYYDDREAGVLTASDVRPLRSCGMRAMEPLIKVPKTMLVSEYRLSEGGETLLVANIHGINFTLGTTDFKRQIDLLLDAIRDHTGPLIVAGDFNTWNAARMDIVDQMSELLSLRAVTYKNHNRLTLFGYPLDHVFYRGLELIEEESISVTSSDHNPIKVTFRVPHARFARVKL